MNNLKKNLAYQFIYQFLILALPLITTPYTSRVLTPSGVGIYTYTFSVASYFTMAAMTGLAIYGNREIARVKDDLLKRSKCFWEIYAIQVVSALIMIILYAVYLLMFSQENWVVTAIQYLCVIACLFDINWFFFGMQEFRITVIRNIIIKLAGTALIFLLVKKESDLWLYTAIMAGSTLLSQLAIWPFLTKHVIFRMPRYKEVERHIGPDLLLFLPVISVSVYKTLDKIMIRWLSTMEEVGYYGNAEKIASVPTVLIAAASTVMMPLISNMLFNGKFSEAKTYVNRSMQINQLLGCGMGFGLAGVADTFTPVYFGNGFERCTPVIVCLSIMIPVFSIEQVLRAQYLSPAGKDKGYLLSVTCAAIANVSFNFLLIPQFGAVGAAIGTVIAESTVCGIQMFLVRKDLPIRTYCVQAIPFVVFGLLIYTSVYKIGQCLDDSILTLLIQVLIGGSLYIVLCFGYLLITKSNLLEVFGMGGRQKKK